jgi:hypothetical protein
MSSVVWSEASSEVIDLAQELIHSFHSDLLDARIGFLFRSSPGKSQGFLVHAKVTKVNFVIQALFETKGVDALDYFIWIAEESYALFSLEQRKALIDHQLCHCIHTDKGFSIVDHDFEEFSAIIERYGFWNGSLLKSSPAFQKAIQLDLGIKSEPQGDLVRLKPNPKADQFLTEVFSSP